MNEPGPPPAGALSVLSELHRRRLRDVWRSAGWPCRDTVEIELLEGGLLLRHADKGAPYAALPSQCWHVLREGIGEPDEWPDTYGVMLAERESLRVVRPAPRRPLKLPFVVWMSLARSTAAASMDDAAQGLLSDVAEAALGKGRAGPDSSGWAGPSAEAGAVWRAASS